MKEEPIASELVARWADILKAAAALGDWAGAYSHGRIKSGRDIPDNPPATVPVFDNYGELSRWGDRRRAKNLRTSPYGLLREFNNLEGIQVVEYCFGAFALFRLTREQNVKANEGYEDTAGTDNERFIQDGDHVIVVYMM